MVSVRQLRLLLAALLCPAVFSEPVKLPGSETLHYGIEWRLINAGKATMSWSPAAGPSGDKDGWEIKLHLQSSGLVSKLYKVDDLYTSQVSPDLCAVSSHLLAHEGRRRRETTVTFNREENKAHRVEKDLIKDAVIEDKVIDIPPCVHDVLGGLFKLRTLSLEPGETIQLPLSDGKKSVSAKIEAQQREDVKTKAGTFKTIRYQAYLFDNVLYRRSAKLYVWLTDDARRLPVQIRVRMQFTIGTITLQLQKEEHS
jgi:hypothetical protein